MHNSYNFLSALFQSAVDAADPRERIESFLPSKPSGRTVVVGAGKASALMAAAFEKAWGAPVEGCVITRYGHAVSCRDIEIVEAAHPVPDEKGVAAARKIYELAASLTADDLLICLISGGGSALLSLPTPGLSFEEKRAINAALLKSGAPIHEMNCVRKHLSAIKGGRLAAIAAPARVCSLLISDVPGDDPATIASGPTVPDPTSCADALSIIRRYDLPVPAAVQEALEKSDLETPKPGDLPHASCHILASPIQSLKAAAKAAEAAGIPALILGDALEGEAKDGGQMMAGIALACVRHGLPIKPPCVLLSGGEATVTVTGRGRGGRNAEALLGFIGGLSLASLEEKGRISALFADTDGIDGTEDNAGAYVTGKALQALTSEPLAAVRALDAHDSFGFFNDRGLLFETGVTFTNVNDFHAVLIR